MFIFLPGNAKNHWSSFYIKRKNKKNNKRGNEKMNELQKVFNYEGREVRTVVKDGEPWFVAKDVCNVLEIGNSRQALARLDDDESMSFQMTHPQSPSKTIMMQAVNEAGLYTLILGSRKPEAKQFKRWVTHEVIPLIRRNGVYMTPDTLEQVLTNPDTLIQLATNLKAEQQKRKEAEKQKMIAEKQLEKAQPHIEFSKAFRGAETAVEIGVLAKVLASNGVDIGRNRLFEWLREKGYMHYIYVDGVRYNVPTQKAIENGWIIQTQRIITRSSRDMITLKAMVTPKGQQYIFNKLMGQNRKQDNRRG
ncbi:phage antirepressor KilAC domain-containing protein (plasmid) [Bacillus licheniformis]|uniref:Phage antirepressor KilAC domain-containing protein n=3 Tax=Bacillus TaxID=1386 RepID=A0AB37GM73_BACLI|nr:phage antirepressor [Bacillus licheniformis]QPR70556.1 phage antirepressor KilAC domain-containing protein [Bacillus licheniformis]